MPVRGHAHHSADSAHWDPHHNKTTNKSSLPIWDTFWEMMEACIAVMMACFLSFRAAMLNHATSENLAPGQN